MWKQNFIDVTKESMLYDHLLQSSLALQEFGMFIGNKIMINIQIAKVRKRTVT
ncbi:MAG: hypothetical protein H6Q69_1466 [Firmicutes bacterium]|nr:hypothetical protein [Bacillota bacterium]